ncbi:MAG: manganese efflux pump MntP family protein [Eubacteriales bacterium]
MIGLFRWFQALMPLVGWLLGKQFEHLITSVDHWIVFALLSIIGGKMIYDALKTGEDSCPAEDKLDFKELIGLSFATSIDALAVGISFAFLNVKILPSIAVIGVTTCVLSMVGVAIGQKFGSKYQDRATLVGGVVLVLIGLRILMEHLGVFA